MFSKDYQKLEWSEIIGLGDQHKINWAEHLKDVLEMDIYDCTAGGSLIAQLKDVDVTRASAAKDILDRLFLIAYFGTSLLVVQKSLSLSVADTQMEDAGTTSITEADREFKVLSAVLTTGHLDSQIRTLEVLGRACAHSRIDCFILVH